MNYGKNFHMGKKEQDGRTGLVLVGSESGGIGIYQEGMPRGGGI